MGYRGSVPYRYNDLVSAMSKKRTHRDQLYLQHETWARYTGDAENSIGLYYWGSLIMKWLPDDTFELRIGHYSWSYMTRQRLNHYIPATVFWQSDKNRWSSNKHLVIWTYYNGVNGDRRTKVYRYFDGARVNIDGEVLNSEQDAREVDHWQIVQDMHSRVGDLATFILDIGNTNHCRYEGNRNGQGSIVVFDYIKDRSSRGRYVQATVGFLFSSYSKYAMSYYNSEYRMRKFLDMIDPMLQPGGALNHHWIMYKLAKELD